MSNLSAAARVTLLFGVILPSLFVIALGRDSESAPSVGKSAPKKSKNLERDSEEKKWITLDKSGEFGGTTLEYTATVGDFTLGQAENDPAASISFIAYNKKGGSLDRPLTFVFNGGPGSSSIWLHMGALGPKRVGLDANESFSPASLSVEGNPDSWLSFTDLVFIDPVRTGYSRESQEKENKGPYYSPEGDAKSVAEFIRLYTTRNGRWLSPKYIAGESYGAIRSILVSKILETDTNMSITGIVLISSVLDFATIRNRDNNFLPCVLYFPSFAALAWYHDKIDPSLKGLSLSQLLTQAREFAINEYLSFLAGARFRDDLKAHEKMAKKIAQYTGIKDQTVIANSMKISGSLFRKQLLSDQGLIIGRFSGTYKGNAIDENNSHPYYDPSFDHVVGGFKAGIEHYLYKDLGVRKDKNYNVFGDVWGEWKWGRSAQNNYLSVSDDLRNLLLRSPSLKVFVANGYYDLATPFFATEYTIKGLKLKEEHRRRIKMHYYEGGHMMYTNSQARTKLSNDAKEFYTEAGVCEECVK